MAKQQHSTAGAPLFTWGDALRAARHRRRTLRVRGIVLMLGAALLGATIIAPPTPRLVWNASASAPVGLYRVSPSVPLARGNMVVAWAPSHARSLAAARHYLPANVPLVKRVTGVAGDEICALGRSIYRDGRLIAVRRLKDGKGRTMPHWQGCRILRGGDLFLLMDAPDSFDGRYFGMTDGSDIIGKAQLLWAH
jgi:conjugative transfer signal peptidase TraF